MKKFIILCLIIVVVFAFIKYQMNLLSTKVEFTVTSSIDRYYIVMSSVPGFPLEIAFQNGETGDYKIHWKTNNGHFVSWDIHSGKVENKGSDIITEEMSIYWSPVVTDSITEYDLVIEVEILGSNDEILGKRKLHVHFDKEEGFYYMKD